MSEQWNSAYLNKVVQPDALNSWAKKIRRDEATIATLNGSFDLMHAGHLQIIFEASQQADKLIVALNSDSSIQQYKSADRPIIPLPFRLQMMAALSFVDYVTWFEETDPRELLKKIAPDVHVNGADYESFCIEQELVESLGGRAHFVKLIPGLSTSQIIARIGAVV